MIAPTTPNISPMRNPPPPTVLNIEKTRTIIEPVLTFDGSPLFIMNAPTSTKTAKTIPTAGKAAIKGGNSRVPAPNLSNVPKKAPKNKNKDVMKTADMSIKTPAIDESIKAIRCLSIAF